MGKYFFRARGSLICCHFYAASFEEEGVSEIGNTSFEKYCTSWLMFKANILDIRRSFLSYHTLKGKKK